MRSALSILVPKRYRQLFMLASVATILFLLASSVFLLAVPAGNGANVQLVECVKGAPLHRVADEMERKGLVRSSRAFVLVARIKGVDGKVQAGTYQFNDGMRPGEILRKMVDGDIYAFRFAVPEGYSIYQLAELLEGRRIFPKADFLAACSDSGLLIELGIPGSSVEGYLFPSTYNIPPGAKPSDVIRMMVGQFEKRSGDLISPLFRQRDKRRHELVTLASMIEKEAVDPQECPTIASVFANRLKIGMRLQSDPTAVYGLRAFSGKVTGEELHRHSPYNTYQIAGLPPGPIGNPGPAALQAAVTPARSSYLYFVSKKDGTHFFSTTLDQHNRAVTRYLKGSESKGAASQEMPGYRNDNPRITRRR